MSDKIVFSNFDEDETTELEADVLRFCEDFDPVERGRLCVFKDDLTGAAFIECHVEANSIVAKGTTDVALDPDNSAEYLANREIVTSHAAFDQMCDDAVNGRKFSNIVCEYLPDASRPLQVIGGQHRFEAISKAAISGINVRHGIKVYFDLSIEQRLDVQVISNTNISVPADLLDRMFATIEGADLREWCQSVGLLEKGQDFADKNKRGNPITVREARTFIANYFLGTKIDAEKFEETDTTPRVMQTGERLPKLWVDVKSDFPNLWEDNDLKRAGKEYALLIDAQREYFRDSKSKKLKGRADQLYKTRNIALLAGWAFVAGVLHSNEKRLERHFSLRKAKTKDPLRAELLAKGKHATNPENYRGLGFRSDPKERGRFAELFWLQAEKGEGFSSGMIDTAIKGYEAKRALLAYREGKAKL